jgi:hypothetical protein
LIDHKVPWTERDSLPLLVVGGTVAWVPGVTIDDRFRLRDEESAWVAEWLDGRESDPAPGNPGGLFGRRTIDGDPAPGREESGN